jgi:hypothetical protein
MAALCSYFTIETLGRRKMFLIGSFGQMISMIITFACLIPGTKEAAKGAVFGYVLFDFALRSFFSVLEPFADAVPRPLDSSCSSSSSEVPGSSE